MGVLSNKVKGLNIVLLDPKYGRDTKIGAEWKLLMLSELLRDYPIIDHIDKLSNFVKKVATDGIYDERAGFEWQEEAQALLKEIKTERNDNEKAKKEKN